MKLHPHGEEVEDRVDEKLKDEVDGGAENENEEEEAEGEVEKEKKK